MAKKGSVSPEELRKEALETALVTIERKFGQGSVMRLSDDAHQAVPAIPTGSIGLDLWRCILLPRRRKRAGWLPLLTLNTRLM